MGCVGSRTFGADVIRAQMNQRRFFTSLAMEMFTMIDWYAYMFPLHRTVSMCLNASSG